MNPMLKCQRGLPYIRSIEGHPGILAFCQRQGGLSPSGVLHSISAVRKCFLLMGQNSSPVFSTDQLNYSPFGPCVVSRFLYPSCSKHTLKGFQQLDPVAVTTFKLIKVKQILKFHSSVAPATFQMLTSHMWLVAYCNRQHGLDTQQVLSVITTLDKNCLGSAHKGHF